MFIGDNARFEFRLYQPGVGLERVMRLNVPALPVTDDDHTEYREAVEAFARRRGGNAVQYVNRFFAAVPWHDTKPFFGWLYADDDGRLWASSYDAFGRGGDTYDVFEQTGVWRGRVKLPNGLEPLVIGDDYIIGKRRDEYDVEFVGVYGLTRTP